MEAEWAPTANQLYGMCRSHSPLDTSWEGTITDGGQGNPKVFLQTAIRQTGSDKGNFEDCSFLTRNKGNPIIDNPACSRKNLQCLHSIYIILGSIGHNCIRMMPNVFGDLYHFPLNLSFYRRPYKCKRNCNSFPTVSSWNQSLYILRLRIDTKWTN